MTARDVFEKLAGDKQITQRPTFNPEPLAAIGKEWALATIPVAFEWATFADPVTMSQRVALATALEEARKCAAKRVLLVGGAGTGKTSLACAMLRRVIEAGNTNAAFMRAYSVAKARLEYPLGQGEAPLIERALRVNVLVLDDVGAEQARNTAIAEIVYERHAQDKTTIITTGFGFKQLGEMYGDGIRRRMHEGAAIIKCGRV